MNVNIEIKSAIDGNKEALENIVGFIQDDIYYLSLRMLANPEDAKDATQDILIKVITNLSSFKFNSAFKTWVYRISANHLFTRKNESNRFTFETFKTDLESDLSEPTSDNGPEHLTMLNELRISCTVAMLLCLSPSNRMVYILGHILEVEHQEGSEILSVSKDNYRQKLSRSRTELTTFMQNSCGLVNNKNRCSCPKKLNGAIQRGRIQTNHNFFSRNELYSYSEIKNKAQETSLALRAPFLQKSIQHYTFPMHFHEIIESLTHISSTK